MLDALRDLRGGFWRGVFPHQMAFVLDLPGRRWLLSPTTLVTRLSLRPESRVLEIGAGSGHYSGAVAASCRRLVMLDLQPEMLKIAKGRLTESPGADYVAADASLLPFHSGSFDIAYMVTVFGEIPHQRQMLAEVHRVLSPQGVLSVSEHLPDPDFEPLSSLQGLVEQHRFRLHSRQGPPWAYTANFRKG